MKSKKGFTLVEILVVVAIVAILATLVLVGIGPSRTAGQDARRLSDMRQGQTALELYFNAYGEYPVYNTSDVFDNFDQAATDLSDATDGVVRQIPRDPRTTGASGTFGEGLAGDYGYWSDGITYILFAVLDGPLPASSGGISLSDLATPPDVSGSLGLSDCGDDGMLLGQDGDGDTIPDAGAVDKDVYCIFL